LLIGGSAGGKLDFQNTYIYDGTRTLRHHAVVTFIKLAPEYRFGVFKSQNFRKTSTSFTVLAANPIARTIHAFLDHKTNMGIGVVSALSEHFRCPANDLNAKLTNYTFDITIKMNSIVCYIYGCNRTNVNLSINFNTKRIIGKFCI
jgi:hypothetical protein